MCCYLCIIHSVVSNALHCVITIRWEQPCVDLLKKLTKHEFLDISRTSVKVFRADFFRPVVELFPELAEPYLEKIR
jgi:hypothetical protein